MANSDGEDQETRDERVEGDEEAGESEQEIRDNEEDEGPIVVERPEEVSPREMERHRALGHPVFRSWCEHCVKGRAKATARKKRKKNGVRRPEIQGDYATMSILPDEQEGVNEKRGEEVRQG